MRGVNVFDELKLPQCEKEEENFIFRTITNNSLAPPKCEHCLPPCNNKKYEFKVLAFLRITIFQNTYMYMYVDTSYILLLIARKLKEALIQTGLFWGSMQKNFTWKDQRKYWFSTFKIWWSQWEAILDSSSGCLPMMSSTPLWTLPPPSYSEGAQERDLTKRNAA